ncbi:hypothetical protein HMPREF0262_00670 [Clostridium sp. ATCC 29733]|nr:hypothetical protein HMPREF0262_00670 [Clostridium sp. ATCC 29733]
MRGGRPLPKGGKIARSGIDNSKKCLYHRGVGTAFWLWRRRAKALPPDGECGANPQQLTLL